MLGDKRRLLAGGGLAYHAAMPEMGTIQLRYSDGYEAHARLWLPPEPRGAVLYFHGIQSHGLWFEGSAGRIAQAGLAVLLPDRRGSGLNQVDRGHAPSAKRLLDDAAESLAELIRRTGVPRCDALGVSWGGKLAMALYGAAPERVRSITLVAPGLFPKVDISLAQKIRVGLSAVAARHSLFDIPLERADLFTENPVWQEFIRTDGPTLRQVTAAFLLASRRLDALAIAAGQLPSGPPLRLFLAGQDRIINNAQTAEFVRRITWPDREIITYDHAHHTLDFEADPEPFYRDLVAWLAGRNAE